jgi:transcriptional adapter 2-alpha
MKNYESQILIPQNKLESKGNKFHQSNSKQKLQLNSDLYEIIKPNLYQNIINKQSFKSQIKEKSSISFLNNKMNLNMSELIINNHNKNKNNSNNINNTKQFEVNSNKKVKNDFTKINIRNSSNNFSSIYDSNSNFKLLNSQNNLNINNNNTNKLIISKLKNSESKETKNKSRNNILDISDNLGLYNVNFTENNCRNYFEKYLSSNNKQIENKQITNKKINTNNEIKNKNPEIKIQSNLNSYGKNANLLKIDNRKILNNNNNNLTSSDYNLNRNDYNNNGNNQSKIQTSFSMNKLKLNSLTSDDENNSIIFEGGKYNFSNSNEKIKTVKNQKQYKKIFSPNNPIEKLKEQLYIMNYDMNALNSIHNNKNNNKNNTNKRLNSNSSLNLSPGKIKKNYSQGNYITDKSNNLLKKNIIKK